jgi:hypothetical protein
MVTNKDIYTPEKRAEVVTKTKEHFLGWPSFIANNKEREEYIKEKMNGRRYDEPGMEVRFKPK